MTKPLSPAAQAVLDACDQTFDQCGTTAQGLAAALRAVVVQVFPIKYVIIDNYQYEAPSPKREQILSIAAELEKL